MIAVIEVKVVVRCMNSEEEITWLGVWNVAQNVAKVSESLFLFKNQKDKSRHSFFEAGKGVLIKFSLHYLVICFCFWYTNRTQKSKT